MDSRFRGNDEYASAFAGMTTDTWIPAPAFAGVTFFRGNDEFGPLPGWGPVGYPACPATTPTTSRLMSLNVTITNSARINASPTRATFSRARSLNGWPRAASTT